MQSLYQQHYHKHDILATMAVEKGWYRVGVTIPCDAYIDRRELERSTYYNEFLNKTGVHGQRELLALVARLPNVEVQQAPGKAQD